MLVLACRVAAIALIALAFARPMLGAKKAPASEDSGSVERIVILDVSQSLAATSHGATLFERARAQAANHLRFEAGLRANLIFAGARAKGVFEKASPNVAGLSDELGRAAVTGERLNLQAAVTQAAEMLQRGQERAQVRRELVIVSDLQRTNWSAVNFDALPKDTHITIESVAPKKTADGGVGTSGETLDNIAITAAAFPGRVALGQETRLEIELANFSRGPRKAQLQVSLEGRTYPVEQDCPPGGAGAGVGAGDVHHAGMADWRGAASRRR